LALLELQEAFLALFLDFVADLTGQRSPKARYVAETKRHTGRTEVRELHRHHSFSLSRRHALALALAISQGVGNQQPRHRRHRTPMKLRRRSRRSRNSGSTRNAILLVFCIAIPVAYLSDGG
jgi:hypothetical protein